MIRSYAYRYGPVNKLRTARRGSVQSETVDAGVQLTAEHSQVVPPYVQDCAGLSDGA